MSWGDLRCANGRGTPIVDGFLFRSIFPSSICIPQLVRGHRMRFKLPRPMNGERPMRYLREFRCWCGAISFAFYFNPFSELLTFPKLPIIDISMGIEVVPPSFGFYLADSISKPGSFLRDSMVRQSDRQCIRKSLRHHLILQNSRQSHLNASEMQVNPSPLILLMLHSPWYLITGTSWIQSAYMNL